MWKKYTLISFQATESAAKLSLCFYRTGKQCERMRQATRKRLPLHRWAVCENPSFSPWPMTIVSSKSRSKMASSGMHFPKHSPSCVSWVLNVRILIVFIIFIINVEQLQLPLRARLAAVLSGLTASFFGKGNFVMVEAEGYSGVPSRDVSGLITQKACDKTYTASPASAWSGRP